MLSLTCLVRSGHCSELLPRQAAIAAPTQTVQRHGFLLPCSHQLAGDCMSQCAPGQNINTCTALADQVRSCARLQMLEMRQLLFGKEGNGSQLPWLAWKQGFFFCDRPGLGFGLVQRQGGPCGLLAALQVATLCDWFLHGHATSLDSRGNNTRAV